MEHQHHAYLYVGHDVRILPTAIQQTGVDVEHRIVASWGIEESRQLAEAAAQRPVASHKRVFVIITGAMTVEAQNALLKLLEDPPPTAVFYLVVPYPEMLLETVRSRMVLVAPAHQAETGTEWSTLRAKPLAGQLAEVAERAKQKDIGWQRAVLAQLVTDDAVSAPVRLTIERYRQQPGTSRKMLIEAALLSLASA